MGRTKNVVVPSSEKASVVRAGEVLGSTSSLFMPLLFSLIRPFFFVSL